MLLAILDISKTWTEFLRFWSLSDGSVRAALVGVLLLGISCGTLGSFVVLRRLSLLGDSLGHAVLPGVCLGFLVTKTKDMRWILAGAVASALLGSWLVMLVQRKTRLKPDVAMGLVLAGFFGVGVVLLTRMQNFPYGNQSGLNQFLFGQAAAIDERDLRLMSVLAVTIVAATALAFKELAASSFDPEFAQAIGLPVRAIHVLLMTLLALAIVVALQAVGVVLLSAMLITPAATAYLLTDRLRVMVALAIGFAVGGGVLGLNLSFLGRSLPTGPFIVLVLSVFFSLAYAFSPRYGVVTRALRRARQRARTERENLLKRLYVALGSSGEAAKGGDENSLPLETLAQRWGVSPAGARRLIAPLARRGFATLTGAPSAAVSLTPIGSERAQELIRNYRLWERFLEHEIRLPADHLQHGAEDLEHILGPDLARELEAQLPVESPAHADR